ncbi:hypothetical protein QQM39_28335 [Streptomyces sp. DT2A-34]|uniref:hypothetical protein n=1 Tax=Streptomyces sp. DT2A-34 TaxID=3051182 RepID=UPI00265BCFBE|nr:hypothetical protein [Streptomyces sp. DT2A-34]MDO0914600.1 hypothetical protein [Streptomyces sp. DT2A-34]
MRASTSVSVALAGALVATACSSGGGDEKNYTVPRTQCGISFNPELLDPFLPGGEVMDVKQSSPNGGTKRCDVIVDGETVVREVQVWWNEGESVTSVAAAYAKMDSGQVVDGDRYFYSGAGGVGKTTDSCKSTEHPGQDLYAVIQVFASGRSDSDAMKNLITSYTKALEGSGECR